MAVQKRLALTISPEYLDLLHKVSSYQNIPTTTFVMGLLEGQRPVVEAMLKAFQDLESGKEKEKVMQIFLHDYIYFPRQNWLKSCVINSSGAASPPPAPPHGPDRPARYPPGLDWPTRCAQWRPAPAHP